MDEPLIRLRAGLADRYLVARELGSGGMASVYLADDIKHHRAVAVKVLRHDLSATLGATRFLREIHTLARLQHPRILPLHDSGEVDGTLYYVMPYMAGESLRERLKRERQLPLDDAIRIAQDVAAALTHAHAQGVVHRDIKPENILFSGSDAAAGDSYALVADFGIARAISAVEETQTQLTGIGVSIGTPAYMSPEQIAADPIIDGRTDVYALGCVVYEMLAGHPPFLGSSAQEIMARHARDPVPPLRTIRPDLPESIERVVGKALAKSSADRFQTAATFIAALSQPEPDRTAYRARRTWAVGIAAAVAVLLIGYALTGDSNARRPATTPRVASQSIAVLPFANAGGDSTNEPFSDGITDELTTALGRIDGLSVMARTSTFSFKRKGLEAREVGRRLHVQYVVVGNTRRSADKWRIGAQLIDVANGNELWADSFDEDARNRDIFAIQDAITRSIIGRLRVKLSAATNAVLAKRSTGSAAAHELYLQGRYFFARRDGVSLQKAQQYFERAIANDSSYALAYAGLSDTYSHRSVFGYALPRQSFPKAKQYALQALALDSTLVEAHASLAFIALFYDWDWDMARREFDRALALDSLDPPTHLYHGWYFESQNRMDDAVGELRTALRLDPFADIINARMATVLFYAHRYGEALVQAKRTLELNPNFFQAHMEVSRPYLEMGRCAEALRELALSPEQRATSTRGVVGYAYAKCGRRDKALAELQRLDAERHKGVYVSHYGLAMIYSGLHDTERAMAQLDSAFDERAWTLFVLRHEPAFDPLRFDPRFGRLLERLRLGYH